MYSHALAACRAQARRSTRALFPALGDTPKALPAPSLTALSTPPSTTLIDDTLAKGASLIHTDGASSNDTLFRLALTQGATPQLRLDREQQFGSAAPAMPSMEMDEARGGLRGSDHGQPAGMFGQSATGFGRRVGSLVNPVCCVHLNTRRQRGGAEFPLTGRKHSAEGTLSVADALRAFFIRLRVAHHDNAGSPALRASAD